MNTLLLLARLGLFAMSLAGWCLWAARRFALPVEQTPLVTISAIGCAMCGAGLLNILTPVRWALTLGGLAELTVAEIGKIGAFLDWGLEKDLFLPFKQQTRKVKAGDQVLASLYIDKSGRLCATMNVYEQLRTDSPYKKDDMVTGRIYEISKNFGAFVAVDDCFSALIPKKELFGATEPPKGSRS